MQSGDKYVHRVYTVSTLLTRLFAVDDPTIYTGFLFERSIIPVRRRSSALGANESAKALVVPLPSSTALPS